jgi:glycosyltransferase involved in cell wall biosynthesis
MRLAFLTHEPFHPPSGGGSAEAVYLVRELVRRGHEVHLFCPDFPDATRVAAAAGVTLHSFTAWQMGRYTSLRNFKYLLYPSFLARMVTRAHRATPFDLVLSQHAIAAAAAGRLKRPLGVPVVMNFLDYLTAFMETWPPLVAPPPLVRALMRYELTLPLRHQADGVMTVSDTLADLFADAGYPRQRIRPIYYGYDAALFRPRSPEVPAADGPPVAVMHGSFDHHHLGTVAHDALLRVHAARPDVQFRFVGRETPVLQRFRARLRAEAPGLVCDCTGFIPYAEVAGQLASATLGIVPYEESTGVHCAFVAKIVEYLGTGLPVVSTPLRSAQRYYKGEPALRFAGFEGRTFADAILAWLAEPAERRRALGLAAAARVAGELDWSVLSRRAAEFVEGCFEDDFPGPPSPVSRP